MGGRMGVKFTILVYNGFTPTNIGVAMTKGHFVVEAEESINLADQSHAIIELSKIRKSNQIETLQKMGLDYDKAWKVYDDTKGFLYAIAQHPLLQPMERVRPDWITSYSMDVLSAILFINSWNSTKESDTQIIEQLSGMSYGSFEKELHNLKKEQNAPIRLVGDIWQVISKINLWDLIVDRISMSQIDKLKPILLEVFTEIDPAYAMPPKERWAAHIYEKVMKHSGHIRGNLADTLALFSSFGDSKITFSSSITTLIDRWLQELFETNYNVEAWYSYHSELALLAESNPNSFLKAIEQTLVNTKSTRIEELFADGGDMGGCFHCSLLWALESISWNLDYLPRVVSILAKLSELEIGSNMGNQPFSSLRDIFLGWKVSSSATHKERIEILEYILLKNNPDITWKLLLELLPSSHMSTSGISSPRYQNWDVTSSDTVLETEYDAYCEEINRLLVEQLANKTEYWHDILDNIDKFDEKYFYKILDTFIKTDKNLFDDKTRLELANTLREKIHKHRSHPDSHWAMKKELVDRLEEAFLFIEPEELTDKYQYLFTGGSIDILNPLPWDGDNDYHKNETKLIVAIQQEAIAHILRDGTFDDLIVLIKSSIIGSDIGRTLFELEDDKYRERILVWIGKEERSLYDCAKSYISRYINAHKFDESLLEGKSNIQIAELLLILEFGSSAFEVLKKQNDPIQKLYWDKINWYYHLEAEDIAYFGWVIQQFYKYGHFVKIIDFVSHYLGDIKRGKLHLDEKLIYNTLLNLNPNKDNYFSHSLTEVIKFLQTTKIENDKKQLLEWKYLGLDTFHPVYLEKAILNESTFFVELVSWIYKPKNSIREDNGLTEEEVVSRAKNAKNLLDKVSLYKATDTLDIETLRNWMVTTKEEFIKVDRVGIGDDQIGKQLAQSPIGDDGILPNKVTREVLEEFINDKIEVAFCVAIQNQRGVVHRDIEGGGIAEYALCDKYTAYVDALKFRYPKTAKAMKRIADSYLHHAKREDLESEL